MASRHVGLKSWRELRQTVSGVSYLLEPWILDKHLNMVVAQPAVGKTCFALHLSNEIIKNEDIKQKKSDLDSDQSSSTHSGSTLSPRSSDSPVNYDSIDFSDNDLDINSDTSQEADIEMDIAKSNLNVKTLTNIPRNPLAIVLFIDTESGTALNLDRAAQMGIDRSRIFDFTPTSDHAAIGSDAFFNKLRKVLSSKCVTNFFCVKMIVIDSLRGRSTCPLQ